MMTLLSFNITMTIMFIMVSHPLSMGLILLLQTILISLITGNMNTNFWFSYILFLILVGGMLILFMYMTSIASNEKFINNPKMILLIMLMPMSMMMLSQNHNFQLMNNEMTTFMKHTNLNMSLNKFINMPMSIILIFLIIYLLLAMIATVKITNFKQGPIRQMN